MYLRLREYEASIHGGSKQEHTASSSDASMVEYSAPNDVGVDVEPEPPSQFDAAVETKDDNVGSGSPAQFVRTMTLPESVTGPRRFTLMDSDSDLTDLEEEAENDQTVDMDISEEESM